MNNKFAKELAKTIANIKDEKLAGSFLANILTPKELEEIAKRLQIIKLLRKNVPQQKIAQKLGVGIATVTRGSKELKYGEPGFMTWWWSSLSRQ